MGCSSPRAYRFASIPAATFGSSDPRLLDIAPSPRWPEPFVGFFVGRASSGKAVKAPPGHCPSAGAGRLQEAGLRTGRVVASTLLATCRPSCSVRGPSMTESERAYRSASSRGTRALVIGTNPRDARTCAPKWKFEDGHRPAIAATGRTLAPQNRLKNTMFFWRFFARALSDPPSYPSAALLLPVCCVGAL
jgi:hypothetical protein